ncbi:MAG: ornithine carbamoyltransferase [Phycisphaerae bacterium]|nr:ornithine carbamoyltransferase [Phycisphaerae bacterium]MDW8261595.1 ornithine carbamoyltransferase [Phycisphaerales bacterium]
MPASAEELVVAPGEEAGDPRGMNPTHFISIADAPTERLRHILDVSRRLKEQVRSGARNAPLLAGKTLAMIFEKPSLRTRVSFAVAMTHLGGTSLVLRPDEVGLGTREPVKDVARVLSGMCDGIMARVFEHQKLLELARYSSVPVINGLSDYSHPCQAMADVMTIEEHFGQLEGRTVVFIGDGNNVARSLATVCGKFAMRFILSSPPAYALPADDLDRIMAQVPEMDFELCVDPNEAVLQADVLYTDVWVSMGQEAENAKRMRDFAGYCIDSALLARAPAHAVVMHCLPAHRGMEITDEVVESPRSLIFPQAENRLHVQKGLLAVLMGGA